MAAYVVLVQVAGVRLQRVERRAADPTRPAVAAPLAPAASAAPLAPAAAVAPAVSAASTDDPVPIDIVGRGLGAVIRERRTRAAEIWSQTTFFLFDPNSWR